MEVSVFHFIKYTCFDIKEISNPKVVVWDMVCYFFTVWIS